MERPEMRSSNHWILSPVSLYVFPPSSEQHFSVSAATMVFLDENGFNFNDWVRSGRPERSQKPADGLFSLPGSHRKGFGDHREARPGVAQTFGRGGLNETRSKSIWLTMLTRNEELRLEI